MDNLRPYFLSNRSLYPIPEPYLPPPSQIKLSIFYNNNKQGSWKGEQTLIVIRHEGLQYSLEE